MPFSFLGRFIGVILLNFYRCEATPDKPQAFGCEHIDVEPDSQNLKFCAHRENGERDPHQDSQPEKTTKVSFDRLWANLALSYRPLCPSPFLPDSLRRVFW